MGERPPRGIRVVIEMAAALIEKWYRFTDIITDWLIGDEPDPHYSLLDKEEGLTGCCEACDEEEMYKGLKRDYPA